MEDPELIELLDDERAAARALSRERERVLRQAAEEGASLQGALLDLAETGTPATVRTVSGRAHHGLLVGLGADFVVVRAARGALTCIRITALTTVRPRPGARRPTATGDRRAPRDVRLVEHLAAWAADRPRASVLLHGGEALAGQLRGVGTDVVSLRLDGDADGMCYVAADAIMEITVG